MRARNICRIPAAPRATGMRDYLFHAAVAQSISPVAALKGWCVSNSVIGSNCKCIAGCGFHAFGNSGINLLGNNLIYSLSSCINI